MDDSDYYKWEDLIERVASATSRDFPDSTKEDLQQNIWVGLLEEQQKGKLLDPEAEYTYSALFFIAKSAAWAERKEHLTLSPQYGYRTKDVRKLLKTFFERDLWIRAETPDDAESELNHLGMEMSADLSRAWDYLSMPHKVLIFNEFGLHEKQDTKKLSKAISRLADILNTYHYRRREVDGPGSRKVMKNSEANALMANHWDRDWQRDY